jgi:HAMP domain-containing protein
MTSFDVVWIAPLSVMAVLLACALVILFWIEPRSRNRPH